MNWGGLFPLSFCPFCSSFHLLLFPFPPEEKKRFEVRINTSGPPESIAVLKGAIECDVHVCRAILSAHSYHHQHIMTDAFPQIVGEAILKGLLWGFLFARFPLLFQLVLEPDPSSTQL